MLLTLLACTPATPAGGITVPPDDTVATVDTDVRETPDATVLPTGRQEALTLPGQPVRFAVLGDAGLANRGQYEVGAALAEVCAVRGCDFALYLGDNFYGPLPKDVDSPEFDFRFERPYASAWFPFWVVLGNHDYALGLDYASVEPQIAYTAKSDRWTLPNRFYTFTAGNVRFMGLDTEAILYGDADDQAAMVDAAVTGGEPWKIAYGHHPYRSNGFHGNAGAYDGIEPGDPRDAVPRGDHVAAFFADHVCGKVDVYFAGHDHNRQWLYPQCGTSLLVSGSAARPTPQGEAANPSFYEEYDKPGFLWVEIAGDEMKVAFYDDGAQLDFEGVLHR